jgi:hypothetical protein
MVNDFGESKQLRRDWGPTLSTRKLSLERLSLMQEWSKQHRTRFRIQITCVPRRRTSRVMLMPICQKARGAMEDFERDALGFSASHIYGRVEHFV